jgi:hypothetical protein
MALKGPDRQYLLETAKFRLDEVVERGYFVMLASGTPGYVKVVDTDIDGDKTPVIGCLLNDVILDESDSRPVNFQKAFEVWKGGKVPVLEAGRVRTNVIHNHDSALGDGAMAYVNQSGILTNVAAADGYTYKHVGWFESDVDSDGYVDVRFSCL